MSGLDPCSAVDLHELVMSPFNRLFGSHALHGLGVHVDHDVFGDRLGRGAARWPGITRQSSLAGYVPERQQHRIDIPYRVLLPILGCSVAIALLRGEPLPVDFL